MDLPEDFSSFSIEPEKMDDSLSMDKAAQFYFVHREKIEAAIRTREAAIQHILGQLKTAFGKAHLNYRHSGGNEQGLGASLDPTGRIYYHVEVSAMMEVRPHFRIRIELSSAVQPHKRTLLRKLAHLVDNAHLKLVESLEGPEARYFLIGNWPIALPIIMEDGQLVAFVTTTVEKHLAPVMDKLLVMATELIYKDVGLDWE